MAAEAGKNGVVGAASFIFKNTVGLPVTRPRLTLMLGAAFIGAAPAMAGEAVLTGGEFLANLGGQAAEAAMDSLPS